MSKILLVLYFLVCLLCIIIPECRLASSEIVSRLESEKAMNYEVCSLTHKKALNCALVNDTIINILSKQNDVLATNTIMIKIIY